MLKLNDEKTKVVVLYNPYFTDMLYETQLIIGDAVFQASESVTLV